MQSRDVIIEPIGGDLLAFAQVCALDATVFPHSSLPSDSTHAVLVARAEDRSVLGFAATQVHGRRLAIIGLAVDEKARRAGIGRALITRVMEAAASFDLRDVCLHVAVANLGAIALYEHQGFRREKRIRGFYRTGDAWLMVKTLS